MPNYYIIKQLRFLKNKAGEDVQVTSYYSHTGTILPFRVFTTKVEDAKQFSSIALANVIMNRCLRGSAIGVSYKVVKVTSEK
jgi:hypothetical protein